MPDDLGYHLSHTRKLGDVKKFIDEGVKPLTDLLPLVMKMAAFIGGALLIGYASNEHFFYDLSSLSVVTLLIIVFFTFSFLLMILVLYSYRSMLWFSWGFYLIMDKIYRKLQRPVKVQLRPHITLSSVLFSLGLFVMMILSVLAVYLQKRQLPWPIVWYFLGTGFLINLLVTTELRPGESRPPGESESLRLLIGFVGVPILTLFLFGAFGSLLNSTMTFLSFRSPPGQLVSLNGQAYHKVMAITAYTGVTIHPCEIAKDFWVLREGILVWHGVGATAYLRIPANQGTSLLIPVPNDGVEVLYSTGIQLLQHCLTYDTHE